MARSHRNQKFKKTVIEKISSRPDARSREPKLHPDTRKSIWAVVFLGLAAVFALAGFGKAGPAGEIIFKGLSTLLGVGYAVLPITLFFLAAVFFASHTRKVMGMTLIGGGILMLAVLGLIDLTSPGEGGWLGLILGSLRYPFGQAAAVVIDAGVLVIAILMAANVPLRWPERRPKEETEEDGQVVTGESHEEDEEPKKESRAERKKREKEEAAARAAGEAGEEEDGTEEAAPVIVEAKSQPAKAAAGQLKSFSDADYKAPPLDLLTIEGGKPTTGDLRANANIIKRTLESFGIPVDMGEINIGPKVTRYTLKPAEGVKLSRITALSQDLALQLAAHPIRIEAPIPGKSLVGIEVPNKTAALVRLGSLMAYKEFTGGGNLGFVLGRDVTGEPMFADIERMPHMLIAGATGSGKTCAAGTFVFSEKGMLSFEEICPLPMNSQKDFRAKVASRDGVEMTSITYHNGICDFYRLTTSEGYFIEVTAEHPLWVLHESGMMGWKASGEIKAGDYVAISRGAHLFGEFSDIEFEPSPLRTSAVSASLPEKMTPELGLLFGLLTADGGLTIQNRIVYTQANQEVLRIYQDLLKKLFGIDKPAIAKSGKSNQAKDVIVHSVQLKEFFEHLGLTSAGARDKEIPWSIRRAPAEVIKAFLQGFIRNDGHVSSNSVQLCIASRKLAEQVQILLLNFGVVSGLHPKKVAAYPDREYWRLTVHGNELKKYAEEIGFLTGEEREKVKHHLELNRNPNRDIVPHTSGILHQLSEHYRANFARLTNNGWQYKEGMEVPKYAFPSLKSYNNGDRNPTYAAMRSILEFYRPIAVLPEYEELRTINDKNFYWAQVKKIGRTRGEGYDFEVPGSHSFVGNGFVNHNSVVLHSMIVSLFYKNSPATLRTIMIDPKRVELSAYEGLPHLVSPVVTENKKAIGVFRWALAEMDRRYDTLLKAGNRDIKSYNAGHKANILPYLLIVVDELADLMSTYGREVEGLIVRLAQMARATGIHLVLATQRPSVEVITGLIKANIPARIALQVASQIDSRTILDFGGAEKLLGGGDMLFTSAELKQPRRIQGAYVTESEISKVAAFIRNNNTTPEETPTEDVSGFGDKSVKMEGAGGAPAGAVFDAYAEGDGEDDDLYAQAVETVAAAKKASASLLQRRLSVGYARAARLLDLMEERGVIGPGDGAKPREVYVDGTGAGAEDIMQ